MAQSWEDLSHCHGTRFMDRRIARWIKWRKTGIIVVFCLFDDAKHCLTGEHPLADHRCLASNCHAVSCRWTYRCPRKGNPLANNIVILIFLKRSNSAASARGHVVQHPRYWRHSNVLNERMEEYDDLSAGPTGDGTINLSSMQWKMMPAELMKYSRTLLHLNMSNNQLISITPEIGNLFMLRTLDMSLNQIEQIDPGIGKCIRLQRLNVSKNRIKKLPPEIGKCSLLVRKKFGEWALLSIAHSVSCIYHLPGRNHGQRQSIVLPSTGVASFGCHIGNRCTQQHTSHNPYRAK